MPLRNVESGSTRRSFAPSRTSAPFSTLAVTRVVRPLGHGKRAINARTMISIRLT